MIRKGFKVLRHGRWSAYVQGAGAVQYPVGKWVKPKKGCGPLGVFIDRDDACWFASDQGEDRIVVECEYTASLFRHFWRTLLGVKDEGPKGVPGTRWAKAVKTLC